MLTKEPLIGGWEQSFADSVKTVGDSLLLFDNELWTKNRRTNAANSLVTSKREFSAIRNDVIQSLKNYMSSRLELGKSFAENISSLQSFCNFSATRDDITLVWKTISPDLNLADLADQYNSIQLGLHDKSISPRQVLHQLCNQYVKCNSADTIYQNALALTLARILVCKPHSADCERLISAYNRLKSNSRASLNRETIVDYLYINVNMPPLSEFDARPAVCKWLHDKDRRSRQTPKASKQKWLQSVFECNADDSTESRDESKRVTVRKF